MPDIEVKILAGVQGQQEIKRLTDEVKDQEEQLRKVAAAYPNVTHAQMAQIPAIRAEIDMLRTLKAELGSAERAINSYKRSADVAAAAGAKSRLGLGVANTLQDMIQGGPASGINNLLGMAGDGGIKALAGEWVAAAGGIGTVAAALGGVVVAAGAAFVAIDQGLKSAKLGWSDLDDVVANTHAWVALEETIGGVGVFLNDMGITWKSTFDAAYDVTHGTLDALSGGYLSLGETILGQLQETVVGWSGATEAARQHKEEVERNVRAAQEYVEAEKALRKVRSGAQKDQAEAGKNSIQAIADLGGAGGLDAVARKLAERATAANGEEKITATVMEKGEDGKLQSVEKEMTRRQKMEKDFQVELAKAAEGDAAALAGLMPKLKAAGYDVEKLSTDIMLASKAYKDAQKEAEKVYKETLENARKLEQAGRALDRAIDKVNEDYRKQLDDEETDTLIADGKVGQAMMEQQKRDNAKQDADDKKVKDEHHARVDKQAGRFDQFFAGDLSQEMMLGLQSGKSAEATDKAAAAKVERVLKATSKVNRIPAELRGEVAAQIVANHRDQFDTQATGIAMAGGMDMGMDAPAGWQWDKKGRLRHVGIAGGGVRGGSYTKARARSKGKVVAKAPPAKPGSLTARINKIAREATKARPGMPLGEFADPALLKEGAAAGESDKLLKENNDTMKQLNLSLLKLTDGIPFML